MPSKGKKIKLEAASARRTLVLDHFDRICKSLPYRRRWVPDVVFVKSMNQVFNTQVHVTELNAAIRLRDGVKSSGDATEHPLKTKFNKMIDPTVPVDPKNDKPKERKIIFYYLCNKGEACEVEFELEEVIWEVPPIQIPKDAGGQTASVPVKTVS